MHQPSFRPSQWILPIELCALAIGDPTQGINDVKSIGSNSEAKKRLALLNGLDADFRKNFADKRVNAYNGFYDDALALMKSKDLQAFDLSGESRNSEKRMVTIHSAKGACSLAGW